MPSLLKKRIHATLLNPPDHFRYGGFSLVKVPKYGSRNKALMRNSPIKKPQKETDEKLSLKCPFVSPVLKEKGEDRSIEASSPCSKQNRNPHISIRMHVY